MYLNVILTIFVIVQIITIFLIYKFWGKYGKQMFTLFTEMRKNVPEQMMKNNPFNNIPDMGVMMKQLTELSSKFKK